MNEAADLYELTKGISTPLRYNNAETKEWPRPTEAVMLMEGECAQYFVF